MLNLIKRRFEEHPELHPELTWEQVEQRLAGSPQALEVLARMEETGGEPEAIALDEKTGEVLFCDCSRESPAGRRSLCYDDEALQKRKKNPPAGSAVSQAREMGVELMDEELYRRLQGIMELDLKTSSWRALLRATLRQDVHLPQRRRLVLWRPRLAGSAARVRHELHYCRSLVILFNHMPEKCDHSAGRAPSA